MELMEIYMKVAWKATQGVSCWESLKWGASKLSHRSPYKHWQSNQLMGRKTGEHNCSHLS